MKFNFFSLLILFGFINCYPYGVQKILFNNCNWYFKDSDSERKYSADVPSTVHTDLLENKLINNPFYRTNEKDLQWIGEKDWIYETVFNLNNEIIRKENIEILFNGIDTYADIFINDSLLGCTDNMHKRWNFDIKSYIKPGENTLKVYFHSTFKMVEEQYNSLGYTVPVSDNDQADKRISVFTRKAWYHYGWDWGPRFVTCGIWRPVEIIAWNDLKINDIYVRQLNLEDNHADVETNLEIESNETGKRIIKLFVNNDCNPIFQTEVFVPNRKYTISLRHRINDIKLWWPNGMGEQNLYNIKAVIYNFNNEIMDSISVIKGFRDIEVVQESHSEGKSFEFRVNGEKMFAKGTNYIPQDMFLDRVSYKKYHKLIDDAKNVGFNMIRVWGGGIYEDDIFYDLCDKNGILVWQDFMFACGLIPPFDDLKDNIYREAVDNIKRLRNHASLAIWCGNNEIMMAYGKQLQRCNIHESKKNKDLFYAYIDVFNKILPAAVKAYDDRFYWASSPNGENYAEEKVPYKYQGDNHSWWVWWANSPFEHFNEEKAAFFSEYGFQSFPEFETVKEYTIPEDYDIESEVMLAHQRSNIGNQRIREYMKDWYKVPDDFQDFLYVGQLLQAKGIKTAIESHRRMKPFCMGTLFWQFNDCWPVASWSCIDYYGRWKALYYEVKRCFKPTIISMLERNDSIYSYVVSDERKNIKAKLRYKIIDFYGKTYNTIESEYFTIKSDSSMIIDIFRKDELTKNINKKKSVLIAELVDDKNNIITTYTYYFVKPKDLILPKAKIDIKKEGEYLYVKSNRLVKDLWLYIPGEINPFDDNYFDLIPDETKRIKINCENNKSNILFEMLNNI